MNPDLGKISFELFKEKEKNKRIKTALRMLANTRFNSKRELTFDEGVAYGEGVLDVQEAIIIILKENK